MPKSAVHSFNGQKLRQKRLERGLSLTDVGKKTRMYSGVISRWEHGDVHPSDEKLIAVLQTLNVGLFDVIDTPRTKVNLAELRLAHGFTRIELAEAMGMSRTGWASIESGLIMPTRDKVERLIELFGMDASTPEEKAYSERFIQQVIEITRSQYYDND